MRRIFGLSDIIPLLVVMKCRKPLIIPFPYDLYGFQRAPEHLLRLNETVQLYHMIKRRPEHFDGCRIECSGGLPNKNGLATADDMQDYLLEKKVLKADVFIGEKEHTHTGHQVYLSANRLNAALCNGEYDVIIPISNPYHLRRILLHYRYYGIDRTYGMAIPFDPGLKWKIKEGLMYSAAFTIDRSGHLFDFAIKGRRERASKMPV